MHLNMAFESAPENGWITIHLVVKDDKILLKVRNGVQSSEILMS
jgi:hypothetical protein